jgi:RNase P/RNase MRP subunit p29
MCEHKCLCLVLFLGVYCRTFCNFSVPSPQPSLVGRKVWRVIATQTSLVGRKVRIAIATQPSLVGRKVRRVIATQPSLVGRKVWRVIATQPSLVGRKMWRVIATQPSLVGRKVRIVIATQPVKLSALITCMKPFNTGYGYLGANSIMLLCKASIRKSTTLDTRPHRWMNMRGKCRNLISKNSFSISQYIPMSEWVIVA